MKFKFLIFPAIILIFAVEKISSDENIQIQELKNEILKLKVACEEQKAALNVEIDRLRIELEEGKNKSAAGPFEPRVPEYFGHRRGGRGRGRGRDFYGGRGSFSGGGFRHRDSPIVPLAE